ncbi:MAG: hypothetical protein WC581_08965 [Thermodesulfovibrionales bacterium]
MAVIPEKSARLEDFIILAKEGKKLMVSVQLQKDILTKKANASHPKEIKDEVDIYLLEAAFSFAGMGAPGKLTKVYVIGFVDEPYDVCRQNISIANTRLRTDYKRLEDAGCQFEKKYWE